MTEAEIALWSCLRLKQINGLQFYRQKPLGKYIVDFYCPKIRLIVEVDGGQHFEDVNISRDKIREEYLEKAGFKVLRYSNTDVLTNIEGTIEHLLGEINRKSTNLP
jgi:very-short-patch-repair endonuclease